jgi:hypothetical protein
MKSLGLFLIIFFAVFLANVASHFATTALVVAGLGQLVDGMKSGSSRPTQQHSPGLAKDLARLNTSPSVQKEPTQKEPVPVRTKELQRAFENDVRLCKSWRQIYSKDRDETSKMHMESACKRAYGN